LRTELSWDAIVREDFPRRNDVTSTEREENIVMQVEI
jgi:hypothetical protein